MIKVPTIEQLKRFMAYMRAQVFPEFFPTTEAPAELDLPADFWPQISEIARLVNTDVDATKPERRKHLSNVLQPATNSL